MVGRRTPLVPREEKRCFALSSWLHWRRQKFERDKSPEADVACGVDDAHAATTELCYYLVMGNCRAD
jgi:hypothetical protein